MVTIVTPHIRPVSVLDGPNKSLVGVCALLEQAEIPYQVLAQSDKRQQDNFKGSLNPRIHYKDQIRNTDLKHYFKDSDLIWLNTLYSYNFTVKPILALFGTPAKKVIISPRGQLLKGALSLKKRWYLKIMLFLLSMMRHQIWVHYANEIEKQQSLAIFKKYPVVIFNNPISGKFHKVDAPQEGSNFVIGYFGRISKIKNIEFILNLLRDLPQQVVFQIHGTVVSPAYKEALLQLVEELGLNQRVFFQDSYNNHNFAKKSKAIDLIVIPSFSESFCHVFFEAIEAKKIVVASTGLPWQEANTYLNDTVIALEPAGWIRRIEEVMGLTPEQYNKEQEALRSFYKKIHSQTNARIVEAVEKILEHENSK